MDCAGGIGVSHPGDSCHRRLCEFRRFPAALKRIPKSLAFVNTSATAKALFVADSKTISALISRFNGGPDNNFAMIAQYTRANGVQPTGEADLLAKSGMPSAVGAVDYEMIRFSVRRSDRRRTCPAIVEVEESVHLSAWTLPQKQTI